MCTLVLCIVLDVLYPVLRWGGGGVLLKSKRISYTWVELCFCTDNSFVTYFTSNHPSFSQYNFF